MKISLMHQLTDQEKQLLCNASAESVPIFSLNGYTTWAKLVSNYDGDTGNVVFLYNGSLMHMRARFAGYDTCEMKPSLTDPERDNKKKKALAAKARLWELCHPQADNNSLILIQCGEFDKYGRLLITAYPEHNLPESLDFSNSINAIMIHEGHGYIYAGGKKSATFGNI